MRTRAVWVLALWLLPGCSRPVDEIMPTAGQVLDNVGGPILSDDDWPWWRGAARDAVAARARPPITWGPAENVVWRSEVPGRGHASPSVCGGRIFLATADEANGTQSILCYDQADGALLWNREVLSGPFPAAHPKNSHASATPACDGTFVYVPFLRPGALWLTATDVDGHIAWQTEVGPFKSRHGYGSSPVIYRSLVIVAGDNPGSSFLAAVHRRSGRLVWRVARPNHDSYATPTVARIAGRDQLLITGTGSVSSYDPSTGALRWTCDGPTRTTANTIAAGQELVYASGGYPDKHILAIRADGRDGADVTDTHIVWRTNRGVAYVPSPLLHEGLLYIVDDEGVATCFDAASGTVAWRARLGGSFSASPVLAAGHIYIPDESGTTHVFKAGRRFERVARNKLGDGGFASPAICGDRIYLRTENYLYCLGEPLAKTTPKTGR